ncbi:sodium-dependent transporter [Pseudidiomarina donghaiensis]|uniref:Sodium-dependent transporter n=1 Tax=Pseudidiomarina donghaiensis TaxID=519452 RepID=A0A432XJU4_9GAMM|nr:sodium-dependent transporter [Pseudidiomarina donghaiensis]RUO49044.1 sodium-dependent transporter [Pseudidiomarina donghaiensis]SFV20532.1 neurotransmitter:Na+ symporter, NSS family [Pseudidiomarina donghaiensis]
MRDSFHTRIGFILAAAGSAIGLGNIWGFPSQAANHGGAAFLLVYLAVVVILAVPALYTELSLGHAAQANPVKALSTLSQTHSPVTAASGKTMGYLNVIGAILMLSFYHLVAAWMVAEGLTFLLQALSMSSLAQWTKTSSMLRDIILLLVFVTLTFGIVIKGVQNGIERWSRRLMPLLVVLLIGLIVYIATLPGASDGFRAYLVPDFNAMFSADLLVSAMGQAFFSLSIGLGGMMIYGSYLKKGTRLGRLTWSVAALDTLVAFLAGLLIIPALYVAMAQGLSVTEGEQLIGEGRLIFQVLPDLFDRLGNTGSWLGFGFFALLSIAALTSTIATAEVPIAYAIETHPVNRRQAALIIAAMISLIGITLVVFFDPLFNWVVTYVTQFQLPLSGLFYFIVIGWLWRRSNRLRELAHTELRYRLLFWHLRVVCPLLLAWVFVDVAL